MTCALCKSAVDVHPKRPICRICWLKCSEFFEKEAAESRRMFKVTPDFKIPQDWVIDYLTKGDFSPVEIESVASEWVDYWHKDGTRRKMSGWARCFRGWVERKKTSAWR